MSNPNLNATADEWLDVEPIGPFEPLDASPGAPRVPAPDGLAQALFDDIAPNDAEIAAWGGADKVPPCKTYAILDAAVMSMIPDLMDAADLEHQCLFTGKALADWGDSAPWLVRLEPGSSFMRRLMTSVDDGGLWELQPGIYMRSRQPFKPVWRHMRRFTRVEDDTGVWFFNRYWSPPVSTALMQMGNHPDVAQFISPLFGDGREAMHVVAVSSFASAVMSRKPGTIAPRKRPVLTPEVKYWMRHIRRIQQFEELIEIAQRHAAKEMDIDTVATAAHLRGYRERFFDMGFWRRDHLTTLCVWELLLGPNFVEAYGDGAVKEIMLSSPSDWEAIARIRDLLDPPPPPPTEAEVMAELALARRPGTPPTVYDE